MNQNTGLEEVHVYSSRDFTGVRRIRNKRAATEI